MVSVRALRVTRSSRSVYPQAVLYSGDQLNKAWHLDKRTFIGMVEAGEPLIQQAVDAMREYHKARDRGAPAAEIERLRLLAESLFQVVSDYQLRDCQDAGKELAPSLIC